MKPSSGERASWARRTTSGSWTRCGSRTGCRDLVLDEAELGELLQDEPCALVGRMDLRVDTQVRIRRRLIRIGDARELCDLTCEGLCVETLDVALRARLDRGVHVQLDEGAELLDHLARLLPRLLVRRNGGDEHGRSVARQPGGDPADPLDVRVPVLLREPEPLGDVLADGVAVEVLDEPATALELRADDLRNRGLAGSRKAGEPNRKAR